MERAGKNISTRRQELTDQVVEALIDQVKTYGPGQQIPSEMELAGMHGVSRGTIREAIKILVSRNVLEIRRGKGTFVSDNPGISEDPWGLGFAKDVDAITPKLLELRCLIEPGVAALAAARANAEDYDELEKTCLLVEQKIRSGSNHSEADRQFHIAIAKATHNSIVATIVTQMFSIKQIDYIPEARKDQMSEMLNFTIEVHRGILNAIRCRDEGKAHEEMARHLTKMWNAHL